MTIMVNLMFYVFYNNKKGKGEKNTDVITMLSQKMIIATALELLPITTPSDSPGGNHHYDIFLFVLVLPNMTEYLKVYVSEFLWNWNHCFACDFFGSYMLARFISVVCPFILLHGPPCGHIL